LYKFLERVSKLLVPYLIAYR